MRFGLSVASVLTVFAAVVLVQSPSQSAAETESFKVDPVHSTVLFRIQHFGAGQFYGRFNSVAGTFSITEGGTGSVKLTVEVESVDTANEKRNGHLKSPDFFNVKQFPTITFESSSLKQIEGDRYEAEGSFTMHGVSKTITVPVQRTGVGKARGGEKLVGFEAILELKRSDFGMDFMQGPLGDAVRVIVALEGQQVS